MFTVLSRVSACGLAPSQSIAHRFLLSPVFTTNTICVPNAPTSPVRVFVIHAAISMSGGPQLVCRKAELSIRHGLRDPRLINGDVGGCAFPAHGQRPLHAGGFRSGKGAQRVEGVAHALHAFHPVGRQVVRIQNVEIAAVIQIGVHQVAKLRGKGPGKGAVRGGTEWHHHNVHPGDRRADDLHADRPTACGLLCIKKGRKERQDGPRGEDRDTPQKRRRAPQAKEHKKIYRGLTAAPADW